MQPVFVGTDTPRTLLALHICASGITFSGTAIGEYQFITTYASTGTISVEEKKLILKNLKLFNSDKKEKVVTATLAF